MDESDRDEARALRCRTQVLDATKQNISRLEKEMTEISKKLEIVFADAATDQVKKYVEELGRRLQSQAVLGGKGQMKDRVKEIRAQPKHVLGRDPNASSSTSSPPSFKDIQEMTLPMRDGNAQSSIASSTHAYIYEILPKHEDCWNGSPTASSSEATIKNMRDGNAQSSIASPAHAYIYEILPKHEDYWNGSPTASSSKATIKNRRDGSSRASSSTATIKNSRDGSSTASSSKATIKKNRDGSSTASSSKASSKKTQKLNKHLWTTDVKCSNCAAHLCQAKNGNKAPKK